MSGEVERSAADRLILRFSRSKSLNEIAELTGLSPVVVAERRERLLADRDVLSHRQRELLLLNEAEELVSQMRERFEQSKERNSAGILNGIRQMMQFVRDISKDRKATEDEISRITAAHARLFGQAFDVALAHVSERIVEEYGVDRDLLDLYVREGLEKSTKMLDSNVAEEV